MSGLRSCSVLLTATVAVGAAAPPALAAPGQLVSGFGTNGVKTQLIGTGSARANGVALSSDRKLLTGYTLSGQQLGAARFTSAGALDTSWDSPFGYTTKNAAHASDEITATAIDHHDRAINAIREFFPGPDVVASLTRWDTDGFTDLGFSFGGVDIAIPGYDLAPKALAVTADDGVVVVGEAETASNQEGFVARVTSAGALDSTFNPSGAIPGVVHIPLNVNSGFGGVAVQDDGKIVAVGWSKGASGREDLTVARFTTTGALDSTFAAGSGHAGQARFRVPNADGNEARLAAVAIDRNGRVLVAGHQARLSPSAATRLAVARLTSAGVLDATWAPGSAAPGALSLSAGNGGDTQATAIAAQPSGSALLAGQAKHGGSLVPFALRIKPTGEPDTGYGASQPAPGFAFFPVGSGDAKISGAVRDVDDTFVLAGQATVGSAPSHQELLLMRLGGQPLSAALRTDVGTNAIGFGDQTVGTPSAAKTLTIFNTGELPIHVSSIGVPAGFVISDPSSCRTATIGGGDSCAFTLSFAPTAAGDASGQVTVSSDASQTSVFVSGNGVDKSNLTPSTDVQVDAAVTAAPSAPGDAVTITAAVNSDRPIVAYLWSTQGPDLNTVSVDTGTIDKLLTRIGLNDATLWVWAVDDLGHVSDTPARIDIKVPQGVCLNNQTVGDLTLGFVRIKSSECIRTNKDGNDFVVPLTGGGASINGVEVRCPTSGNCGTITIKHTDSGGLLQPGDKRAFALRSTTPVHLIWPNGQTGDVDLGDQSLSVDMPDVTSSVLASEDRPVAKAARDLNLSYTKSPPPPISVPRREWQIASFAVPAGTSIGTLPTDGKVALTIFGTTYQYCTGCTKPSPVAGPGIKLTTNVRVIVPGSVAAVSAPVSQEANSNTGPQTSGSAWQVDLGGVGFTPLIHFDALVLRYTPYVPADDAAGTPARSGVFEFDATVGIDITGWTVQAAGTFSKTYGFEAIEFGFHRQAGVGYTGLNVPLGKRSSTGLATRAIPVQLQDLTGNFQLVPYLSVGGGVTVILAEKHLLGGAFQYSEAHGRDPRIPWSFLASVTFPIQAIDVTGTFYVQGSPSPGAGISGGIGFTVKDVIYITGNVWLYIGFEESTKKVQAEFGLRGSVTVFNYPLAGFTAFINNNVVAGCGNLGNNIAGWAVYEFAAATSTFGFGGCDNIAEYSLVPALAGLSKAGARASTVKLRIPAGVDWANLELRSADGTAQAKIEGPGGVSFTSPETSGLTGRKGDTTMALVDSVAHRTVIGIHAPKPGVYTVTPVDGAPEIVDAHVGFGKPTNVKARVTGKGAKRVLHYTVTGEPANVIFEERAAKVDNTIVSKLGAAKGASGTIRFRSADLGPTKHVVVARVTKNGQELPAETVARFTASPVKPAKPKRLRIKLNRRKAYATVRWAKDPVAARYVVKLRTRSGRRMNMTVNAPKFTVPSVYVGDKIKVTVRGVAPFQRKGAPKTVSAKITKAKTKKEKKKTKKKK